MRLSAIRLVVIAALACSEPTSPPPPATEADLQGAWAVDWCALHVTVSGSSATWTPGNCSASPSHGTVSGTTVTLFEWRTVLGETVALELYRFSNFVKESPDVLLGDFLGACDNPLGGGGVGCRRDAGETRWRRAP